MIELKELRSSLQLEKTERVSSQKSLKKIWNDTFNAVGAVEKKMNRQFADVNQQFADVNNALGAVEKEMSQQFADVNQQFADVNQQFAGVNQQFAGVNQNIEKILEAISQLTLAACGNTTLTQGGPKKPKE